MKSLGTINGSPSHPYKPRLHKEGDWPALSPITNGTPCHIGDLFRDPLTEENDTPSRGRSVSRTPARTGSSRSHTSSRPPSPSFWKRTASRSLSAAPPHKQSKTVVPQWLNGQAPTGRPKAHDYEHDVCGLIIKACHDFESRVCSLDAKPDLDKQILWAKDAWKKVCDTVDINYELTDRILGLVRVQHLRYLGELMLACFRSNHVPRMPALRLRIQYAPRFHQHMDLLLPITLTARSPVVTSDFMINF